MDNSPVMMEKPDDLTLDRVQRKVEQCLELIMRSQGLCHIREQIFGYLNYETVENCRKVSELWNESLERIALVKFLQEFGDRVVVHVQKPWEYEPEPDPEVKVSSIVAEWKKAAKEYGFQASLEDLQKVKGSLQNLLRENGKCCQYPVHEAAKIGATKLMEFILRTSFDMDTKDDSGRTVWHEACYHGQTETVQMILKNWKEFGIDIKAEDNDGKTALDLINEEDEDNVEEYDDIRKMLEKEYSD